MEMRLMKKTGKKGLLMTVLILVLFMLILSELLSFAVLTSQYDLISQTVSQTSSSTNYAKVLQGSASAFANASLSRAIVTLAGYELNASMRKGNLVSNTTLYLGNLIMGGTLPNVAAGTIPSNYLIRSMGNLTLSSYNALISNSLGGSAITVSINQTTPSIYQQSPYTLTVSYRENVDINSTSGNFVYQIPVNATVPLNNTPDLFYYQQGIARNINFDSLQNITSIIGGVNATAGNVLGSVYGPVYIAQTTSAGLLSCANLNSEVTGNVPAFSFAPYNQMLIIATPNAVGITAAGSQCITRYGGLITYNGVGSQKVTPPPIPWLQFASSTNVIRSLQNGQNLLLYGPQLSLMNVQDLIEAVDGGHYFASPFTPSYLQRAQGSLTAQDPNGEFSFAGYGVQAGTFNGINSYIAIPNRVNLQAATSAQTVSAWIQTSESSRDDFIYSGASSASIGPQLFVHQGKIAFWAGSGTSSAYVSNTAVSDGKWHQVVGVYGGTSFEQVFVDGALVANIPSQGAISSTTGNDVIGANCISTCGSYFQGSIAGVQVYNTTLSPLSIASLYQSGIGSPAASNAGIVGWWPLGTNSSDISGQAVNGIASNVLYSLPHNYTRDSIFGFNVSTSLQPVPGLLNCNTNSQCASNTLAHIFLGTMPLEVGQGSLQAAKFNNNQWANITVNSLGLPSPVSSLSVSAWVYPSNQLSTNPSGSVDHDILSNGREGESYALLGGNALKNQFMFSINPGAAANSPIYTSNTGKWYFVAGTYNGFFVCLYVNGLPQGCSSASGSFAAITNSLTIGADNNGRFYNGTIANIQIYSNSLTQNQISQLYTEGIAGLPLLAPNSVAFAPNMIGWWPLNGNPNDYSGYGNNGLAVNAIYPYVAANSYNSPGLGYISSTQNEWQALGFG
ncbi:MAG: LamG domain-containing protein [Candidatus Micrarchaeota archaeon]|nr:LamG domain-containing protein [Candidatus Micrarchaeota archaeon]